jgi:hypothetical protein
MADKFVSPSDLVSKSLGEHPLGAVTYGNTAPMFSTPCLVATGPTIDNRGGPWRVCVPLVSDGSGFIYRAASVDAIKVGISGWRVELDPNTVRSLLDTTQSPGDFIMRGSDLYIAVMSESRRLGWLSLADYRIDPAPDIMRSDVSFGRWRLVQDLQQTPTPFTVYEHTRYISQTV